MVPFQLLFPDVARRETRALLLPADHPSGLPADTYGLIELYCEKPGCDCRRVMLDVLSAKERRHVATLHHSFEPSPQDPARTYLDPLNPQSDLAPRLLELVKEQVLKDEDYVTRLHRHYRLLKDAVNDPTHPAHEILRRLPTLPLGPLRRRRRRLDGGG